MGFTVASVDGLRKMSWTPIPCIALSEAEGHRTRQCPPSACASQRREKVGRTRRCEVAADFTTSIRDPIMLKTVGRFANQ